VTTPAPNGRELLRHRVLLSIFARANAVWALAVLDTLFPLINFRQRPPLAIFFKAVNRFLNYYGSVGLTNKPQTPASENGMLATSVGKSVSFFFPLVINYLS